MMETETVVNADQIVSWRQLAAEADSSPITDGPVAPRSTSGTSLDILIGESKLCILYKAVYFS